MSDKYRVLNDKVKELCVQLGINPNEVIVVPKATYLDLRRTAAVLDEYDDWKDAANCSEDLTC